jgi:hypothetical protein
VCEGFSGKVGSEQVTLRIAMWSGPRNISTAMMRSWGNRADTFVCDEPLYAHYLLKTGIAHPGADEVIRTYQHDWRKVVAWLTGAVPDGKAIFFQKHMTHHLLPEIERDWLEQVDHAFLIRQPRDVLISYAKVIANPTIEDTGLPQQVDIFQWVRRRTGRVPPILDADDVLKNPEQALRSLCNALDVDFSPAMLSWAPGPRASDGIWAKYWYAAVLESTGFQPYRPRRESVPPNLDALLQRAEELYQQLYRHRLLSSRDDSDAPDI